MVIKTNLLPLYCYLAPVVTHIITVFSSGTPVSSTNKTDRHDITEILLKVALNTITITPISTTTTTVLCFNVVAVMASCILM
jgi:ABC-type Fe3+ transport system permease subunit